jgi:hypothetical protein
VRLVRTDIPSPATTGLPADVEPSRSIDAWLTAFDRLLRLSDGRRRAITDELHAHLRERIRDLMVTGRNEDEAVRTAITELGEAAELAARFRSADRIPRRRVIMNIAFFGVGLGTLAVGAAALFGPGERVPDVPVSLFEDPPAVESAAVEGRIAVEFESVPAHQAFEHIASAAGVALHAHWNDLEEFGIERDQPVTIDVRDIPLTKLLDLVLDQLDDHDVAEWHVTGAELIEVGTISTFARRETLLAAYDLSGALAQMWEVYDIDYDLGVERIADLVMSMAYPDLWHDNGGEFAQAQIVGGKLFVEAPRRVHRRIAWLVAELQGEIAEDAAQAGTGRGGSFGGGGAGSVGGGIGIGARGGAAGTGGTGGALGSHPESGGGRSAPGAGRATGGGGLGVGSGG